MIIVGDPFKTYDIRGLCPEEVNEELAFKIGKSIKTVFSVQTVVIGYDMRASSPGIAKRLSEGLSQTGINVIEIGMVTTPVVGFTVAHYDYDFGIMISASHNPSQYNAFKLIGKKAVQLHSDTGIFKLRDYIKNNEFADSDVTGGVTRKEVIVDYVDYIMEKIGDITGLKVVIDYGNGVGAITTQKLLEKININAIEMYAEPDGNFPNHPANPHDIENLKDLQERVITEVADLGIFYDGDADRSLIVDENGEIVYPDLLLALLAERELKKHPGETVYYDLRFSKIVEKIIRDNGGTPVMMKVGNPFYKEKLVNEGGILAGEFSGHIMYKENYGIDDGLYVALNVMKIMDSEDKTISALIKPYQKYASSNEINLKVQDADETLSKVKKSFSDGKSIELDGVYVTYDDWWFSLRKSNTEPLVRLRLEADTEEKLERYKKKILSIIQ